MQKALNLMNEMCRVIVDMERSGIRIDTDALEELEITYKKELVILKSRLEHLAVESLGDTPFKLTSNDDLSMLIFSRKPTSKKKWAEVFNLGTEFVNGSRKSKRPIHIKGNMLAAKIQNLSYVIHKTTAKQCPSCKGTGKVARKKRDGTWGKPRYNCNLCGGCGIDYDVDYNTVAGFRQKVINTNDLAAHGYKCGKEQLERLSRRAKGDAKEFLTGMVRFNAISHYLTSFIEGIKQNVGRDGILHTQFMQCVTATGRLSSRSPNFHNQPRGGTFPIRKVIISRWSKGCITEADYAQLEFRVAAALSKDETALQDIVDGVDVHARTAKILTQYGQETSRQDAKTHTFKPLYGGMSGSIAEQKYYKEFLARYKGIKSWHNKILEKAASMKTLSLPTGRQYKFPWAKVNTMGYVAGATKIKNYPVQGFATADIVPLATIKLHKKMVDNNMKSCIINEVHDSIVVDTHPDEIEEMPYLISTAMLTVIVDLMEKYNYEFSVPLEVEVKQGKNWLDMNVVMEKST